MPKSNATSTRSAYETQKKRTDDLYREIVEIHETEGLSGHLIAERLGVGKSTVYRHLAAWRQRVPVEQMKPYCRPPKVTPQLRSTLG